jgi:hypothetical protein
VGVLAARAPLGTRATEKENGVSGKVKCRAKLVDDCYDGREDDPEEPMVEDGTFDGESVVCDACYCAVMPFTLSGQALYDELPNGIYLYRENAECLRAHPDPAELVAQAKDVVARARGGSPRHVSALAALAMAQAEVERREREGAPS